MNLSEAVAKLRERPDIRTGDHARTVVGTVMWVDGDGIAGLRVAPGANELILDTKSLELVERPRKEPRIGSVWEDDMEQYVYLGKHRWWQVCEGEVMHDDKAPYPGWHTEECLNSINGLPVHHRKAYPRDCQDCHDESVAGRMSKQADR